MKLNEAEWENPREEIRDIVKIDEKQNWIPAG